jgi:hypothetical protein
VEGITYGMGYLPMARRASIIKGLTAGLEEIGEDPAEFGFEALALPGPR